MKAVPAGYVPKSKAPDATPVREAETHFRVLKSTADKALVEAQPTRAHAPDSRSPRGGGASGRRRPALRPGQARSVEGPPTPGVASRPTGFSRSVPKAHREG